MSLIDESSVARKRLCHQLQRVALLASVPKANGASMASPHHMTNGVAVVFPAPAVIIIKMAMVADLHLHDRQTFRNG
jgi:hypothetical protein